VDDTVALQAAAAAEQVNAVDSGSAQDRMVEPIRTAVIGFGYWGPNLARNIAACDATEVAAIADLDPLRRSAAARLYSGVPTFANGLAVLEDPTISLVVLATPAASHFELAAAALRAGKHVLVEKPFVTDAVRAQELLALAKERGLYLFVDHTFLFTGAVRRIREEIGPLGDLLYYDATRTNLGTLQRDTDVLWDLAPHDVSILLSLVERPVELVAAMGARQHPQASGPTMAYLTLRLAGGVLAHIHVNWMAPAKVRRTIFGGSRRMLVYDDLESMEKLKIYHSASALEAEEDISRRMVDYRIGDITSPRLDQAEALATEIAHVARVIRREEAPLSDARLGLRVVRVIEAAQRSLAADGVPVRTEI
jgi:predicted dehydrogenase